MTVLYNELNFTCLRELNLMQELLQMYNQNDLTPLADNVFGDIKRVGFNANHGNVWLEDEDCNCLMINGDKLDLFLSTPYSGMEGFIDDIFDCFDDIAGLDDLHPEDKDYLETMRGNQ
jgi:hypothetical protein